MSRKFFFLFLFFLSWVLPALLYAESPSTLFRADHFTRDLRVKKEIGKGKAYLKQGEKEVWADEIEFDLESNKITAVGDVHIKEKNVDIFCARGVYSMSDDTATLEDVTLVSGQMVVSGAGIKKSGKDHFEMEEGYYTNCNNEFIQDKSAAKCLFDWKIYGRKFDITIEGYLHVYDAIIYGKDLPAFYLPYYLAPAKSKRQSGILLASYSNTPDLGNAFRLPYYHVLGSWHDVTILPSYYSKGSSHLGLEYRYIYSGDKQGFANLYFTTRSINPDRRLAEVGKPYLGPRAAVNGKPKELGFIAEYAVEIGNKYAIGERSHLDLQVLRVSDPYYPHLYSRDLGYRADLSYLRSQIAFTTPNDNYLFTAAAVTHQSLILSNITDDQKRDRGPVSQLPRLSFHKKATSFFASLLSYEIDSQFNNFYRDGRAWDSIPSGPFSKSSPGPVTDPSYQGRDYIREGRRLQFEPKLVANFPLGTGFQLQPTLRAGELVYHFDLPSSQAIRREYADISVPFSMYLSKNFKTEIGGFEEVKHVFQPRAIYGSALYRSPVPAHPFFDRPANPDLNSIASPRFDIIDNITNYEFFRIEMSNRLLRKVDSSSERFFLFDVANQYNSRIDPYDPRFQGRLGPLELTTELTFSPVLFRIQGSYQLSTKKSPDNRDVHESNWTGVLRYSGALAAVELGSTLRRNADPTTDDETITATGSTRLPLYVDVGGGVEYSAKKGEFRSYRFGISFAQRPVACWSLAFNFNHAADGINTAAFTFAFLLGGAMSYTGS